MITIRTSVLSLATAAGVALSANIYAADFYSSAYAKAYMEQMGKGDVEKIDCDKTPLKARKDRVTRDGQCLKSVRGPFDGPQGGVVNLVDHYAVSTYMGKGYFIVSTETDHGAVPLAGASPADTWKGFGSTKKEQQTSKEKSLNAGFTRQYRYIKTKRDSAKSHHCIYVSGKRSSHRNVHVISCGSEEFTDTDLTNAKDVLKSIK